MGCVQTNRNKIIITQNYNIKNAIKNSKIKNYKKSKLKKKNYLKIK